LQFVDPGKGLDFKKGVDTKLRMEKSSSDLLVAEQNEIWQKWAVRLKSAKSEEEYAQAYDEVNAFLRDFGDPALGRKGDGTVYGDSGSASHWEKTLIILLAGQPCKKILEIGCGDGRLALALAQRGAQVKGIDISKVAVEVAQQIAGGLKLEQGRVDFGLGNAMKLEDASNTFDYAVSADMAEHLQPSDFDLHLKEVHRVLKPGGAYIITLPGKTPEEINDPLHLGNYTRAEVAAKLVGAGFKADCALETVFKRVGHVRDIFGEPRTAKSRLTHALSRFPVIGQAVGLKLIRRWTNNQNFFYAIK
jgi:ubiquinone/menaquinone biosynthesis C-methylase UbiE